MNRLNKIGWATKQEQIFRSRKGDNQLRADLIKESNQDFNDGEDSSSCTGLSNCTGNLDHISNIQSIKQNRAKNCKKAILTFILILCCLKCQHSGFDTL